MGVPLGPGVSFKKGDAHYDIEQKLGEGGFAVTYRAQQTAPIQRIVAVKVPKPERLADATWAAKFDRESRILANVSHANVVRIIDTVTFDDGQKCLVQEFVEEPKSLFEVARADPSLVPSFFLQALYGLRAAHQGTPGSIHRDVSPGNLLVCPDGTLKIIDFGLAREMARSTITLTMTGEQFGTIGCVAPEQLANAATVDHRVDLYGVGRTFAGVLLDKLPMMVTGFSKLKEPWRTICERMTEDDAADRPAGAAEAIAEAMDLFAQHKMPLRHFALHASEHRSFFGFGASTTPSFARLVLATVEAEPPDTAFMSALQVVGPDTYALMPNVDFFLGLIEASPAVQIFINGDASFEDADPLGAVYRNVYEALSPHARIACFARMVHVAVRLNRYSVMHRIRDAYVKKPDPGVRAQHLINLKAIDTFGAIEGRGMIPI